MHMLGFGASPQAGQPCPSEAVRAVKAQRVLSTRCSPQQHLPLWPSCQEFSGASCSYCARACCLPENAPGPFAAHLYTTHTLAVSAGPSAAKLVIDSAVEAYPLAKSLPFQAAKLEVEFWQELRHGRARAARAIAGKLTAMPSPHGRTEFQFRHDRPPCSLSPPRGGVRLRAWHVDRHGII